MSFREIFRQAIGLSAPELTGGDLWLNSDPITIRDKANHLFLIDFWTYT